MDWKKTRIDLDIFIVIIVCEWGRDTWRGLAEWCEKEFI